jgi:hypothetical protein
MNNSEEAPLTFGYHWYVRLVAVIDILLFAGCSLLSIFKIWGKTDGVILLAFPALTLLGIVLLLWTSKRYTVRQDGILARTWYGQEDLHFWAEMDTVESTGLGSGIRIKNQFGKTVLEIDPWIARYGFFVEVLRQYQPGLFVRQNKTGLLDRKVDRVERNPILPIAGILSSLIFIVPSIKAFWDGDPLVGTGLLLFGILIPILVLRIPMAVYLQGDALRIQYLLGQRMIPAETIRNIYARVVRDVHGGGGATGIIELIDGRKIELAGFKEGTPVVVNVLRNWREDYLLSKEEQEEKESILGKETPAGPSPDEIAAARENR